MFMVLELNSKNQIPISGNYIVGNVLLLCWSYQEIISKFLNFWYLAFWIMIQVLPNPFKNQGPIRGIEIPNPTLCHDNKYLIGNSTQYFLFEKISYWKKTRR